MPVLSTRIVLDCFYLVILYSEKFSTDVCRLPYAENVNLNLSKKFGNTTFVRFVNKTKTRDKRCFFTKKKKKKKNFTIGLHNRFQNPAKIVAKYRISKDLYAKQD